MDDAAAQRRALEAGRPLMIYVCGGAAAVLSPLLLSNHLQVLPVHNIAYFEHAVNIRVQTPDDDACALRLFIPVFASCAQQVFWPSFAWKVPLVVRIYDGRPLAIVKNSA